MPKAKKWVPPFLDLTMHSDGVKLLRVWTQKGPHLVRASQQFGAELYTDPHANLAAIALTLVEVAETIVRGRDPQLDEKLAEACQALYLVLMVVPDLFYKLSEEERDDLPF